MSSFLSSVFLPRILVVEFAKAETQAFRVLSARSFRPLTAKPRTVIASERFCSHPVVELAIAEMACVSRNVRRTLHVPSGVPVQRSISERDVSYPSYFANPPPQRLSSLFSRGHRRFVEGCLLKHQLVM